MIFVAYEAVLVESHGALQPVLDGLNFVQSIPSEHVTGPLLHRENHKDFMQHVCCWVVRESSTSSAVARSMECVLVASDRQRVERFGSLMVASDVRLQVCIDGDLAKHAARIDERARAEFKRHEVDGA